MRHRHAGIEPEVFPYYNSAIPYGLLLWQDITLVGSSHNAENLSHPAIGHLGLVLPYRSGIDLSQSCHGALSLFGGKCARDGTAILSLAEPLVSHLRPLGEPIYCGS